MSMYRVVPLAARAEQQLNALRRVHASLGREPKTLDEIALGADVPRSTAFRYVLALVGGQLAARVDDGWVAAWAVEPREADR
jgi:DNA-binding IclR family transcriptional regulator